MSVFVMSDDLSARADRVGINSNHLVISSASIMFHRFMTCQAFQNHDRFIVCATCVFLAGKIEEQPKRLKDVVDVFLLIRSKVQTKIESVSYLSEGLWCGECSVV